MADYDTTLSGQSLHHSGASDGHGMGVIRKDVELTPDERKYLMAAERGDVPTVQQCLRQAKVSSSHEDIYCFTRILFPSQFCCG
jgi:hypothetical protein